MDEHGANTARAAPGSDAPRLDRYFPWIDGLRAVAVLAVLIYHFFPSVLPGGLLGVDVFFVISGYLISSLLLGEMSSSGGLRLREFYGRRARRLLPALLATLVAIVAVGVATGRAALIDGFRTQVLGSLFYVTNWTLIMSRTSYFASSAESPVKHLWSLAIEEQFYIVAPLLLLALRLLCKSIKRWQAGLAGGLAVASCGWAMLLYRRGADHSRIYYGTDTHAGGLLIGVALGIWCATSVMHPRTVRRRLEDHATVVLFLALLVSLYLISTPSRLYQGGILFVDVATATLLYQLRTHRVPLLTAPLTTRTLTAVGRRSYALYLVHWPLATLLAPGNSSVEMGLVRVGLSFAAAEGLHRFVENRFRTSSVRAGPGRVPSRRSAVGLLVASMIAVVVLLAYAKPHTRLPGPSLVAASAVPHSGSPPTAPLRVDVFGDSTALVFGYYGSVAGSGLGVHISGDARRGCGTIDNDAASRIGYFPRPSECAGWRARWSTMAARDRPDVTIVMTGAWEMLDQMTQNRRLIAGTPRWTAVVTAGLTDALRAVAPASRRVIVMPLPCFGARDRNALPERADPWRISTFNAILADVAAKEGAVVSNWRDLVCPNGVRLKKAGGSSMWLDDGIHLSPTGAVTVWKWLLPQLATARPETASASSGPKRAQGEPSTIRLVGRHTID